MTGALTLADYPDATIRVACRRRDRRGQSSSRVESENWVCLSRNVFASGKPRAGLNRPAAYLPAGVRAVRPVDARG